MATKFQDKIVSILKRFRASPVETAPQQKPSWHRWGGVILIALSVLLYGALFALAFIPISIQDKIVVSSMLVILAEGAFLIGGLILGKQVVERYRRYLDPRNWRKSSRTETK